MTLFRVSHRILKQDDRVFHTTPTLEAKPLLEFLAFKLKIISNPEIADHKHHYSATDVSELAMRTDFHCSSN